MALTIWGRKLSGEKSGAYQSFLRSRLCRKGPKSEGDMLEIQTFWIDLDAFGVELGWNFRVEPVILEPNARLSELLGSVLMIGRANEVGGGVSGTAGGAAHADLPGVAWIEGCKSIAKA